MEFKIATSEEILAKLPDWDRQIKALDQSRLTDQQLDQVLDAEWMIMEIANQPCEKLRGVILDGNVESVASISIDNDAIYLEFIVTSPKNLNLLDNPERIDGASSELIIQIVRESIRLGFEGRIYANCLESSQGFYDK